jgi:hypothetical protein
VEKKKGENGKPFVIKGHTGISLYKSS